MAVPYATFMALEVCVLGSGSKGNAVLVRSETTAILVDAGFSCRELTRRLNDAGQDIAALAGICVSHEHSDHVAGLAQIHKRHQTPFFGNHGTIEAMRLRNKLDASVNWSVFTNGSAFGIGDLRVEPFSVPHDAYDPVGFVIQHRGIRAGILTDAGVVTALMREQASSCHLLVLESNHDEASVQEAERPWFLKQRILGRQGHLSNRQAADLIQESAGAKLQALFLAHLSEDCNTPEEAERCMRATLDSIGREDVAVMMTHPGKISTKWSHRPDLCTK